MSPRLRSISVPSGILTHTAIRPQLSWAENWGEAMPPFWRGSWIPIHCNLAWTEAHLHDKCHLDPSSRLAKIDMGRKLGAPLHFLAREAGYPSNTKWPGPRPTSIPSGILIHPAIWPQEIWVENWERGCASLGEGELGPHLIQCSQGQGLPACHVSS